MTIPFRVQCGEILRHRLFPRALSLLEKAENALAAGYAAPPPSPDFRPLTNQRAVLILLHGMGGGADKQALADAETLAGQGYSPFLLTFQVTRRRFALCPYGAPEKRELFYVPFQLKSFWVRLDALGFAEIRLHHLRYWPAYVAEALPSYIVTRHITVTLNLHDFYYVCPRLHLVTGDYKFCELPQDASLCDACVKQAGHFVNMPKTVSTWRAQNLRLLQTATEIIAPSHDTAHYYHKIFPELPITVRPHQTLPIAFMPKPSRKTGGNIAIVGHLIRHKGADIVLAVAKHAKEHESPLTLTVIGDSHYAAELMAQGVRVTGTYRQQDLPRLLAESHIDYVWLASVWPETYCFVLDEVKSAGYPVILFDLGAPAERTRISGNDADILLSRNLLDDIPSLCAKLVALCGPQDRKTT